MNTAVCNEGVTFTIASVGPANRNATIDIRKDNHTLVKCQVRPWEDKTRVRYVFTVSRDVIPESEFTLSEGPAHKENEVPQPDGGTIYSFRLRDWVGAKTVK